ncbi:filamentous hemagglutinin N-terminal domain-containing protein [Acaryochloris sp. IP29b_bin.148]|uniref:two-partner secretion domain-containing protein n=1 Tax=Acaryochloris sp. IP29b_bin.148 TaxID=2969218 RepID=UPI002632AD5E|nr:filamentous hemagglutinin N-terminal domain-containing protein [Acaryochloris sp. IP29b_bin.148]
MIPDRTLGQERSQVKTIDAINQRVEGGAARGSNLFHSFLDFNVAEGQGVYFANPQGIESILSRVTGQNPSHILGRLGVLGPADLYLLNPNGIVFGPNASLDIQGSFFGSTASSIALGEEGIFSAVAPQQSQLLSVQPQVGFLSQAADHPGSIINQAQLTTGQDLSLTAGQLDLQGQLRAGSNLTLQAADSLKIRDGETSPFVAAAGKNLLVQGNQSVDIFALNHSKSGFFSGRDMVLRSTNPVGGDAHYTSGGSFLVQQLNGEPGTLFSPYDPIIRSLGDVSFDNYVGSSLHILAAGSVNINTVNITGPEIGASGTDFIQEAVQLSDGSTVNIDGSSQPTLDVRAGVDPAEIITSQITGVDASTDSFLPNPPNSSTLPTSTNIDIGNIVIPPQGLVYLTTQYKPNLELSAGEITISGGIDASSFGGDASSVILDARNNIVFPGSFINAASFGSGNSGDITLLANQNVSILNSGFLLTTIFFGQGKSGRIRIRAGETFLVDNSNIFNQVGNQATGDSSGIDIRAKSINVNGGSQLSTTTFGQGNSGDLNLQVLDLINVSGTGSRLDTNVGSNTKVDGGNLTIKTSRLTVRDGAQVSASTFGLGNAGNLTVEASESITLTGEADFPGGLFAQVELTGEGRGGNLTVATKQLSISNGSKVQVATFGQGDAGNLLVNASDVNIFNSPNNNFFFTGIFAGIQQDPRSMVLPRGDGGKLTINTQRLSIRDGGRVTASTLGDGNAGDLLVSARDFIEVVGTNGIGAPSILGAPVNPLEVNTPVSLENAVGNGGNVTIQTKQLSIRDGARVSVSTFSKGDAGILKINASDLVEINGSSTDLVETNGVSISTVIPSEISAAVDFEGNGQGGEIFISTGKLRILNGGLLTSRSQGLGSAGNINVDVRDRFTAIDGEISTSSTQASGGAINLKAGEIRLFGDSDIRTNVAFGVGGSGDINLTADSILAFDDSDILAFADPKQGKGGNITLNTPAFFGENFFGVILTGVDPDTLDGNDRVDLNATGQTSGIISVPDVSFIQNNLTELPENLVNPENLLANSCIIRTADQEQGKFIVTGPGGLPKRPGDAPLSSFPTGTIQTPTNPPTSPQSQRAPNKQSETSIVEPQGVYQLNNGRLVMSRECSDL